MAILTWVWWPKTNKDWRRFAFVFAYLFVFYLVMYFVFHFRKADVPHHFMLAECMFWTCPGFLGSFSDLN